jgi:hypothetical protein
MKLFDRILWRINGVLILGATLLVGVLGLYAAYEIFKDKTRDREVRNIVTVDKETKKEENFNLGSFRRIEGTTYFSAPLLSDENINRGSYSKSSSSTRNYFFYNSDDSSSYWLFPTNEYLINERDELSKKEEKKKKIIGYLYTVIETDSNSDNLLTRNDERTIFLSRESGTELTQIVEGVVRILGIQQIDENLVYLFLQTTEGDFVYHLDIPSKEITKKHRIEIEG